MKKEKLASECIADFLNLINKAEKEYTLSLDEMNKQNKITQDILHKFEIGKLKYNERAKLGKELEINRLDRRYYKDKIELYQDLVQFASDAQYKKSIDILRQILGKVRKIESYHSTRTYKPKVRKE